MMVEYPYCHAESRDDSKFCGDCGAPWGAGVGPPVDNRLIKRWNFR